MLVVSPEAQAGEAEAMFIYGSKHLMPQAVDLCNIPTFYIYCFCYNLIILTRLVADFYLVASAGVIGGVFGVM